MKIYIAGAGAGKTTTMTNKIVELREKIDDYKIIFCLTFTNSAAKCIESRLNKYYGHIPNNIRVSTIHSFLYREIIKPYFFLLYGKHYEKISVATLPSDDAYKNAKIKRLDECNILHQTLIPKRSKWVIHKKTKDTKSIRAYRESILNSFSEYCGAICIDEAQDMDSDMQIIFEKLNEIGVQILIMGDPKQDLKGHGCLRNLIQKYGDSVEYLSTCYRCPQEHLKLSNLLVTYDEQQVSNKINGTIIIHFETDIQCNVLIKESSYDLMYISKKQKRFDTHKRKDKEIITDLSEEIEFVMKHYHQDLSELHFKKACYYCAEKFIKNYLDTNDRKLAFNKTFKKTKISDKEYGILLNALPDNNLTLRNDNVIVNSIESIKGQEGRNCLFILTTDLAAYLFGDKSEEKTTKNLLYVALTRSMDKLTIFITNEVEKKYSRDAIIKFFNIHCQIVNPINKLLSKSSNQKLYAMI